MQKLTNTALFGDTNPGRASNAKGPTWPPGLFDHVKLPSGKLIGETETTALRHELARLDVQGAHTDGRHIIAERYAAMLAEVHDKAGEAAVAAWLASKRS